MSIELTTLPSGLRVITDHVSSVESVALGIWAAVGTRDEDMTHNGVAHMVEHMMFKGTTSRSALGIAEEIENVGGHINAWTSREMTAYHIHVLKEHMPLAIGILADLLQHSTLPEEEIIRERSVILQEIGMTADTPDDLVFDHFQETAYPGQALGAPILGRAEIISSMDRKTMQHYIRTFYTPARLVISAAGNVRHEEFVSLIKKLFTSLPADTKEASRPALYKGGDIRTEKALEQSHVVLGFRGVSRHDPAYYAAEALSTILGGGMSSRLFQEVREKRGLAYSIFCFHSAYQDDGQMALYAGTGPQDLPELIPVLCDEIGKTLDTITDNELDRAKAQIRSSILMGRESMMTRANQQAKQLICFNTLLDLQDKLNKIAAVRVNDVHAVAKRIFATRPTLAALGPLSQLESYDRITKRLAA